MKIDLPPVGSKKWPWIKESTADEDLILVLETPVGYYTIEVECSTAKVTLNTSDDNDLLDVFYYDLMRFGTRTDGGLTLDRAQERRAIARVKRLVECEARFATRCSQEACNQKKSTSQLKSDLEDISFRDHRGSGANLECYYGTKEIDASLTCDDLLMLEDDPLGAKG